MESKSKSRQSVINILISDGNNEEYVTFLKSLYDIGVIMTFSEYMELQKTDDQRPRIHLVVFTGGSDVSPAIYGEPAGTHTSFNKERDSLESNIFHNFVGAAKFLGICRGAQFITSQLGGNVIQHVENHDKIHNITAKLENNLTVDFMMPSTHHQMMNPYGMDTKNWKMIAWSKYFRSNVYLNGNNKQITLPDKFVEPEIVYYNQYKALCIQGHPEAKECPSDTKEFVGRLIKKYLIKG